MALTGGTSVHSQARAFVAHCVRPAVSVFPANIIVISYDWKQDACTVMYVVNEFQCWVQDIQQMALCEHSLSTELV